MRERARREEKTGLLSVQRTDEWTREGGRGEATSQTKTH